jgi:hypothetical protein
MERGTYYMPTYQAPDLTMFGTLTPQQQEKLMEESLKMHMEIVQQSIENRWKLFGLIMQKISQESKDAIRDDEDYLTWFPNKDPEKVWQALNRTDNVDSISTVTQVVEMTARMNYPTIKQRGFEILAQFSKCFQALYKAYIDNRGTAISDEELAMDYFHVIDNNKDGALKAQ